MTDKLYEKKYAIVTGGSKGIGKAIVKHLLDNNYHVAFSYRNSEGVDAFLAEVLDKKIALLPVKADMSVSSEIENFIQDVHQQFGRIDLLVNNVGITQDGLLAAVRDIDIQNIINTNLMSYIFSCREVLRIMLPQRQGNIINVSSISAQRPNKGQSLYAATKGAIESLTKALAVEVAPKNIRVNAIAPGIIKTTMIDELLRTHKGLIEERVLCKKLGSVDNIIDGIVYLLKNDYVTGEIININGGLSLT